MESLEIILIMSGPVLLVVRNVGTLFIEEYFRHEAKFEILHGIVTCGIVALLVANKRGESFGLDFFGGEEMTSVRYAVQSTWLYPYMVMVVMMMTIVLMIMLIMLMIVLMIMLMMTIVQMIMLMMLTIVLMIMLMMTIVQMIMLMIVLMIMMLMTQPF